MSTFDREMEKQKIIRSLVGIKHEPTALAGASISYNAPVNESNAKVEALKQKGYLVVDSYGDDFDCGLHLAYALGDNRELIIEQCLDHLHRCHDARERLYERGIITRPSEN